MKKIWIGFISLLLITGCGKSEDTLVMVTEAGFAPYEYYENGEIVGVDVDIAQEIAKELGKKLVIKDVAFDSIINEIKTGKSDFGAAGISYNEERAEQVAFSVDYAVSRQVVIVKEESTISKLENTNQKVAVQLGSVADTYLTKHYQNITLVRQKKYLAAIQDLKDNKVEAVVMDELPAKEILAKNTGLKILEGEITHDSYGMIVNKNNKELLDAINKVLNRLMEDGTIEKYIIHHTTK